MKIGINDISDIKIGSTNINEVRIGSTLVWARSGFDPDYQAVLDRATFLGYTLPSSGQQILQNSIVVSLKASGVWAQTDIFYVFANDGGQEFATLNWKNPLQFQCSLVNSPAFTSNVGFNSDGATSYINTNWNPTTSSQQMTLNSVHRSFYNYNYRSTAASNILGVFSGTIDRIALSNSNSTLRLNANVNNLSPMIDNRSTGVHVYNRLNSSDVRLLVGGNFTNHTSASVSRATSPRTLYYSGLVTNATDIVFSTYSEGGQLSDAESTSIESAINTYMGSI
jgi:hypothetical protein